MWYLVFGLIIGLVAGFIIAKATGKPKESLQPETEEGKGDRFSRQTELKEEKIRQLREYISDKEYVTNDEIQNEIRVSDATATRYCDELEKEGLMEQIGKTGHTVKYKIK